VLPLEIAVHFRKCAYTNKCSPSHGTHITESWHTHHRVMAHTSHTNDTHKCSRACTLIHTHTCTLAFLPLCFGFAHVCHNWLWHTLHFYRFAPSISYVRHALWTCVPCTLHACDLTPTHVCHNQFVPHVCSGWYSFNQNGITHVKNTATAVGFLYLFYFPLRNYYDDSNTRVIDLHYLRSGLFESLPPYYISPRILT